MCIDAPHGSVLLKLPVFHFSATCFLQLVYHYSYSANHNDMQKKWENEDTHFAPTNQTNLNKANRELLKIACFPLFHNMFPKLVYHYGYSANHRRDKQKKREKEGTHFALNNQPKQNRPRIVGVVRNSR